MSRTEELNNLFKDWRRDLSERGMGLGADGFCDDGIIDETRWNEAPTKILFIAKETNKYSEDLRVLIKKEPLGWKPVGAWAYALQNAENNPSFSTAMMPNHREKALWSSAVMNLKKLTGGSASDMKEILNSARPDSKMIQDQIKIIQPSVIVCCGTFSVIKEIIPGLSTQKPKDADGKCFKLGTTLWIDFCHFGAHFRHDMMYYTLLSFYRNCK